MCPADGTPLRDLSLLGQILGERYRVLRVIGEGGMGTVYLAEHVVLGKHFAIKILRPEYSQREDLVRRFQQEAVAASQIGQENIVDVVDFGRTPEGRLYYAMEALDGESLTATLGRVRRLPVQRAVPVLAQIARALGAAHERGIVHRDVKPDNVVLVQRASGELVKVLDFGISMVTGDLARGERITSAGTIVGTPEYMSPEQTVGEAVDHRADIYAWGVLAYEVLTGTLPFEAESSMKMLLAHRLQAPEPLSARWPDAAFPMALETLVMRSLAKSPDERPQSMSEVARELQQLGAALGISTFTPTQPFGTPPATGTPPPTNPTNPAFAPTLPSVPAPSSSTLTEPALAAPRARKPRSQALLALALLALVAGIGGGWALVRATAPRPAPAVDAVPLPAPAPAALVDPPPAPAVEAPQPVPGPHPAPAVRTVHLVTAPAGAKVHADGKLLGTTPLDLEVAEGRPRKVRFALDGYRPARRLVAYKLKASTVEVALQKRPRGEKPVAAEDLADDLKADPYPDAEKP